MEFNLFLVLFFTWRTISLVKRVGHRPSEVALASCARWPLVTAADPPLSSTLLFWTAHPFLLLSPFDSKDAGYDRKLLRTTVERKRRHGICTRHPNSTMHVT